MDKKYQFQNINEKEIRAKGVQALATRPNAAQQYGQSGLTPEALKKWFDQLAELLAKRINNLQDAIQSKEAAKYIGVAIGKNEEFDGQYETLYDLILAMQTGHFAAEILKLMPNENAFEKDTLQNIIYGVAQSISEILEELERLDNDKLGKVKEAATSKRVYAVDEKGEQIMMTAAASPSGQMPLYSANGALVAKMTPIEGMPGGEYPSEVVNMAFLNELRRHIGAGVRFSMDPTNYVVSVDVVNIDGQTIYHTELDLPLEELVVGVTYDDVGKNIVIKLKNGEATVIPVAHIVNGLVTQSKHDTDINDLNSKVDALFKGHIEDVYALVGGDFIDYS